MSSIEPELLAFEESWRLSIVHQSDMKRNAVLFGIKLRRLRKKQPPELRKLASLARALDVKPERIVKLEKGESRDLSLAWKVLSVLEGEDLEQEPQFPDAWTEDKQFPLEDWVLEVRNDDTRLGYVEWVFSQRERREHELAQTDEDDRRGRPTRTTAR